MKNIIIGFIFWCCRQSWFVENLEKRIEKAVKRTDNKLDDAILDFISVHRQSLNEIIIKEIPKEKSMINGTLLELISSIEHKK